MKHAASILLLFIGFCAIAQTKTSLYQNKTFAVKDSIYIDNVSINSSVFRLTSKDGKLIDSSYYSIDFKKALLTFKRPLELDSVRIYFLKFPEFLTKTYQQLDDSLIISSNGNLQKLYQLSEPNTKRSFVPFDGLTTSGSISRGVTIGNNQNSVLNSELDLQITGKLNDKVSLRASIQDANIPLQETGYSQRLDEFDQVFIELYSDRWNVRAGDIDLQNNYSYFANFSKRVQGLFINADLGNDDKETNVFAAGALVRGQFTTSQFTAQEGNQGPYKLQGPNGELFVLVVSGSETVYVNGVPVKRGEDQDYIIDYNAGEIIFNSTYPITSEMRITVDYQFSERNYSRLVAYGGSTFESQKLKLGVSVYSENDSKNQPLQQNLSQEQAEILSNAGDDKSLMSAPSAIRESYSDNRILYRKDFVDGQDVFVFSNNPDDELYRVNFSQVGDGTGDYILASSNAINNIYEYAGIGLGNYAPIVQLVAPVKLQLAVVNGIYQPSEKTNIKFELAGSKNDLNLFSNVDDDDNDGFASKLKLEQVVVKRDSSWNLNVFMDGDYIQTNFRNIEGLYNPEFNRDWNLDQQPASNQIAVGLGNQSLLYSGIRAFHPIKGSINYQFEHLNFSEGFNGNRQVANFNLNLNRFVIRSNSSFLSAESNQSNSKFLRSHTAAVYGFKKAWLGLKLAIESNEQRENTTEILTPLSQKFKSYEVFTGVGDSTKIYTEIGFKHRVNDSIRVNQLQRVNTSNTYYLDTRLIKNKNTNLYVYANYRVLKNIEDNTALTAPVAPNEQSLNSRLQYNQKLFKNIVQWNTIFETNSGTLPQQDFTYIEVEPGQGTYTWIDYNNNGIQELEEFEIAPFQDQGKYIRVLLPNRIFIKTHQNRLSQTFTLNPAQWSVSENKSKKFWSHFYNQTSYLIDRKLRRDGESFNLNPFETDEAHQLGLQLNFRNVLFLNRGKQHYTTSYTYLSNKTRNILSVGFIENNLKSHQLNFNHKIAESWLLNLTSSLDNTESISENFASKNYNFDEARFNPKISYLFNDASRFDLFYQYASKNNSIGNEESLKQQNYGIAFLLSKNEKGAINGELNYFANDFNGSANTPVAYQMLEGLQPGKNFTWSLLAQKKLTNFLDLNLSYFGRKTKSSKTIHTGSVQLKAYF